MTGLPRSIIKKYGVSKKAWAVYRGSTTQSRSKKSTRGRTHMARKRYSRRRGGGGFGLGSKGMLGGGVVGGALLGLGAMYAVNTFAPQFSGNSLVKAGAGFLAGGPVGAAAAFLLGGGMGGTSSARAGGELF